MSARRPSPIRAALSVAALAASTTFLAACGGPTEVEFEVIEEVTFASSLGIDLADFTELASGVWIRDVVVGTGPVLDEGDVATVDYVGYLRSGAQFDAGQYTYDWYVVNNRSPITGWHYGMDGMAEGGRRWLIIPPEEAYGALGAGDAIYPGAIVIFDVTLTNIAP